MSIHNINNLSRTSQLSLAGVAILLGAVFFTVNNALQQQETRSQAAVTGNKVVYADSLSSGWVNWSWRSNTSFSSTNNVYSGSRAITFTGTSGDAGFYLHSSSDISSSSYKYLSFAAKAATSGQQYYIQFYDTSSRSMGYHLLLSSYGGQPVAGSWKVYNIPLSVLNGRSIDGFAIIEDSGRTNTLYIDAIQFTNTPGGSTPTPLPTNTPVPTHTPTPVPQQVSLSVNKTTAMPGEQITASWANIPNATPRDFMALHTLGSADSDYIGWIYVNCTQTATVAIASGSCTFPLPDSTPAGQVELRLHANDGNTILTKSQPITINVPATPTVAPTITPVATLVPTATPTAGPTATPVPGNTIAEVNLLLHGIGQGGDSANPNAQGNNNPLRPQRTVTVDVYDAQNQLALSKQGTVTFDSVTGSFTGNIDLGTQFADGVYTIRIKTDQYLRGLVSGIQSINQGQSNTLPSLTLIAGDVNGDNQINIIDYNLLTGCYSDLLPAIDCTPQNKILTDFNDDGNVNQFDYNLFLRELTNIGGQ